MNSFEKVGKKHIKNLIDALESSQPGWVPMFYHTGSYETDLEEASRLRKEFGLEDYESKKP